MKGNASQLCDHALYEKLAGYFNEATSFSSFLGNDLPDITKYLKVKATILRQFNLDLQAKGLPVQPSVRTPKRNVTRNCVCSLAA